MEENDKTEVIKVDLSIYTGLKFGIGLVLGQLFFLLVLFAIVFLID